jgi:hypothetical protein
MTMTNRVGRIGTVVAELTVKVKVCDFEQDQRRCNQGSKHPCHQHEHDAVLDHLCP